MKEKMVSFTESVRNVLTNDNSKLSLDSGWNIIEDSDGDPMGTAINMRFYEISHGDSWGPSTGEIGKPEIDNYDYETYENLIGVEGFLPKDDIMEKVLLLRDIKMKMETLLDINM